MKQKSVVDRLVKLGMLTGLSIILVYVIHFPIFPAASFLEYDMADVPILIGTFLYGPWWGLALTAVVSLLQWLLVSPQSLWVGAVMHFCATGSYVIAAGLIYGKMRSLKGALIGMAVGAVLQTAMMNPMNLIFTVHFFGVPKETVLALLPTAIIPFNAIKTVANSVLTFLLYKRVEKLLKIEFIKSASKQPLQPELEESKDPAAKP
ncbi:MAG TPA: ECF transporter S component [Feifaniaceae bacterium]|nr:ECF transporter S component [Feifaniaceae bacterium]